MVKPVKFCSIGNNSSKFGIPNFPQSPDLGKTRMGIFHWDACISDFQSSGQSLTKENCHNSRTSDGIDMNLRPVTKCDKRNKTTSKNLMMMSCWKTGTS